MSELIPEAIPDTTQNSTPITFRRGHVDDSLAAFRVHWVAIEDLEKRMGRKREQTPQTEAEFQKDWQSVCSLYEYLAASADEFWVAERAGEIVGYARACSHEGLSELTEFFVDPSAQSHGVGKELLARTFPRPQLNPEASGAARVRVVIATAEPAAQALYMRSGVYARHFIPRFTGVPQTRVVESDLQIEAAPNSPATLAHFATIDGVILGFRRDSDHQWLMSERQAWLYRRQGPEKNSEESEVVGYGYTGERNGPFALLNGDDYPAVLAHAENLAAAAAREEIVLRVHSINHYAVDYLLAQGYKVSPIFGTFLSNAPFGKLDHYINSNPPFFL